MKPILINGTWWQLRFCWLPTVVEDGDPSLFGWRWLCFVWHRWFIGHYADYWRPATHILDVVTFNSEDA